MSNIKKRNLIPSVTGNHEMTWKELAEADDLASALTVDSYLGFTTHKMTDMKLRIPDRIKAKLRDIICDFQKNKCYETTFSLLTADPNIVKRTWSSDLRFKEHINRYLLLFDDRSGIEIRPCWRYASENHIGAAIYATKDWPKGSRINTLIGCIAELKLHEEVAFLKHHKNDFSVMYSSRKNCSQLWLGPAAYVNHDCQPNCEFTINCDADARMSLEAKTDIKRGDEIFIYYGTHFFDINNSACECFTCELLGRGYFSRFNQVHEDDNNKTIPKVDYSTTSCESSHIIKEFYPNVSISSRVLRDRINSLPSRMLVSHAQTMLSSDKPLSLDCFLRKGSSTGLACKAVSNAYSLRHTGSRLERVKARIYAATVASVKAAGPIANQENRKLLPQHKSSRISIRNRSTNGRHRTQNRISSLSRRKSRNSFIPLNIQNNSWEPLEMDNETRIIVNSISTEQLSDHTILPDSDTISRKLNYIESDGTSSGLGQSLHNDCSNSNSPLPPPLDRMSFSDSTSLPSGLTTAAVTPNLSPSYYQNSSDQPSNIIDRQLEVLDKVSYISSCPNNPPLDINSKISTVHTTTSTGTAHATTTAVEPILGRLFNESRLISKQESVSPRQLPSSPLTVKKIKPRLTNYDARLIAEANLFAACTKHRLRKPPTHIDSVEYPIRNYSIGNSKDYSKAFEPIDIGENNISESSVKLTAPGIVNSRPRPTKTDKTSHLCKIKLSISSNNKSEVSVPEIILSPKVETSSDLTPPFLRSSFQTCPTSLYSISDSSQDAGPPSIYSVVDIDEKSETFSFDSDRTTSNICHDLYPEQCMVDDSPKRELFNHVTSNYLLGENTISAEHLLSDHDYSLPYLGQAEQSPPISNLPTSTKLECRLQKNLSTKSTKGNLTYTHNLSHIVHTPPPPILHPEIPPMSFEFFGRDSLCRLKNNHFTNASQVLSRPQKHIAHNTDFQKLVGATDFWTNESCLNQATRRLTVTLKRVGPKHYQISQPKNLRVNN